MTTTNQPTVDEQRAQVLADNPGLDKALTTNHHIVEDISARFAATGRLSEKQIALVFKLAKQDAAAKQREAEREVADMLVRESGITITPGKQVIFGSVVSLNLKDSGFGPTWKMIVEHPSGLKYWGTVPSNLVGALAKGDQVEFTATVSVSDNDPKPIFGFYKRPTNAALIKSA